MMPDARYVRTLLARYASSRIALAEKHEPTWQRELEDVSYTLCVVTGTRLIADALAAADDILAGAGQCAMKPRDAVASDTALAA